MDEKGYAFTPLAFLLFIPIIIFAVAYGDIVSELNALSNVAIGGDVTYTTAMNIYSSMEKGSADAGRYAAYNATRTVIDNRRFMDNSKGYMENQIRLTMNDYIILTARSLQNETGRQIFVNNISITNTTFEVLLPEDVYITQESPYGYYVNIKGDIPIKVVQKDQVFEGKLPSIKTYVTFEGLEDPYIWINTNFNKTDVIYAYPYYGIDSLQPNGYNYRFNESELVDKQNNRINYLWDCLNGTGNPSQQTPRPYYFPDPHGLTFFDRLENRTNSTSQGPDVAKMSTFILGDPLFLQHNRTAVSRLDHEYFGNVNGQLIFVSNNVPFYTPDTQYPLFYLSPEYNYYLGLD